MPFSTFAGIGKRGRCDTADCFGDLGSKGVEDFGELQWIGSEFAFVKNIRMLEIKIGLTGNRTFSNPWFKVTDSKHIVFEGKIPLNDFYKIANTKDDVFEEVKGEADTLAGLILELRGEFPKVNDKLAYRDYMFHVKEMDKRRIKLIHVTIR